MAKKVKEYYDEYGNLIRQSAAEQVAAAEAANTQWDQDMAAAEKARLATEQANMQTVTGYLNQGLSAQEALLKASQSQLAQAEAEGQQQVRADLNAAKYTGLTNLAASVANMIGVGHFNAVSQQYKDYSQDWMRKADMDMRTHRMRIDNLRERLRGVQQRHAQLKTQNNLTIAQMQNDAAKARDAYNARMADARRAQAMDIAGMKAKGDNAAAEAALQGGVTQAKMDQQDAHQRAQLGAQAAARAAQMRAAGRNPDGTVNEGYMQANLDAKRQMAGWTKTKNGKWVAPATGADDLIDFRVSSYATPEGTLPAFDVHVSASRLNNSILASINDFTDISNRQKREIEQLINSGGKADDIAKKLMTYIGPSKQMREFVKDLNNELKEEEPEEVEPPKPAPRGAARDTSRFSTQNLLESL